LYLTRATAGDGDEPDPDLRIIEVKKANRSRGGQKLFLRWYDEIFVLDGQGENDLERLTREFMHERVFLSLLDRYNEQNRRVSDATSSRYAPKVFSEDPDAQGITSHQFKAAMSRLFNAGKIKVVTVGPPSKERRQIERAAA
jgi:hypothetical protein